MLQNALSEIGEVIPLSEADLYTKTGGKLLEVNALEGSAVTQGQVLFVFDGADLKNEQDSVLAEIAVLDSQIEGQISTLERQKSSLESERVSVQIKIEQALMEERKQQENADSIRQLYDIGAVPVQDLSNAQLAYEQTAKNRELLDNQLNLLKDQLSKLTAEINDFSGRQGAEGEIGAKLQQQLLAQKNARLAQVNLLREQLSEIEVRAPQEGMIRDSSLKEGQIIPPGTKLCSIYQADMYRVDCYILVENTAGVQTGDEVEITLRLRDEDKKYQGMIVRKAHDAVDRVSKVGLSEKRIKIEIVVEDEGWAGIGPYWPVEVRFVTAQAENCLLVPKTALFADGGDIWKVWVVRDGAVSALTVEKGIQTPSQVEIRSGLDTGDIIIKNAKTAHDCCITSVTLNSIGVPILLNTHITPPTSKRSALSASS
jgi:HlyD family secretion protein